MAACTNKSGHRKKKRGKNQYATNVPPINEKDVDGNRQVELSAQKQSEAAAEQSCLESGRSQVTHGSQATRSMSLVLGSDVEDNLEVQNTLSDRLCTQDLKEVRKAIFSARLKWYDIGVELGMDPILLETIKSTSNNHSDSLTSMLKDYLKGSYPRPTWESLANALKQVTVGEGKIAEEIEKAFSLKNSSEFDSANGVKALNDSAYQSSPCSPISLSSLPSSGSFTSQSVKHKTFQCLCGTCSLSKFITQGCPDECVESNQYPYLNTKGLSKPAREDLEAKLDSEVNKMRKSFASLSHSIVASFESQGITPIKVARCALSIGTFSEEDYARLKEAQSIDATFFTLLRHMSFFNYELLEFIIEKLGTANDCDMFGSYKTEFEAFCKRSVFEVPPDIYFNVHGCELPEDCKPYAVKLEGDWNFTVGEVKSAQRKIATILDIQPSNLLLRSVHDGCVKLEFSLQLEVHNKILPLNQNQVCELKHYGMTQCGIQSTGEYMPGHHDKSVLIETTDSELEVDCQLKETSFSNKHLPVPSENPLVDDYQRKRVNDKSKPHIEAKQRTRKGIFFIFGFLVIEIAVLLASVIIIITTTSRNDSEQFQAQCKFAHLIVAHENINNGIELTTTSSSLSSNQQITVVFPNESFPEECGPTLIRCNLTILSDEHSSRVVIVIPVVRGAALAMFIIENNTMLFVEQYVLELALPSYNCHLTNFLEDADSVTGLCFNFTAPDPESRVVRYTTLDVNFNNLNSSTFQSTIFKLDFFLPDTSQTVFFEVRPRCLDDDADRLYAFAIVGHEIAFLHLRRQPTVFQMFFYGREVDCSNPRRVVRVSNSVLVAYCDNATIEVNVCDAMSETISVIEFRVDEGQGVRYYCSSDRRMYVTEKNGNLTVSAATEFGIPSGHTLELPPDVNDIFIGDCITVNDQLLFLITSSDGQTHMINLQQGSSTLLGESDDVIIPHVIYNSRNILYRNGTHSLVYNISCPLTPVVLEVDVQFQLSAYFENDETFTCLCEEPIDTTQTTNDSVTTEATNTTTTEPMTESTTEPMTEPTTQPSTEPTTTATTTSTDDSTASTLDTTTEILDDPVTTESQGGLPSSLVAVISFSVPAAVLFLVVIVVITVCLVRIVYKKCVSRKNMNYQQPVLQTTINCNPSQESARVKGNTSIVLTKYQDASFSARSDITNSIAVQQSLEESHLHIEQPEGVNLIVDQSNQPILAGIRNEKPEDEIMNSINDEEKTPQSECKEVAYHDPDFPKLEPALVSNGGNIASSLAPQSHGTDAHAVTNSNGESSNVTNNGHLESGYNKNRTAIQPSHQPQVNLGYDVIGTDDDKDDLDLQSGFNQDGTTSQANGTTHPSGSGHVTNPLASASNYVDTGPTEDLEEPVVSSGQFCVNSEFHQPSESGDNHNESEVVTGRNLPINRRT